MTRPDLIVMGAGVTGLAIAWAATRRGARVRVIEVAGIGAGASGGVVGALMPHAPGGWTPVKAFQFASLIMAPDWWAAVAGASGQSTGYGRTGRLQPLADAAAVEAARVKGADAATLWQGWATWQVVPLSGAPWEPASASGWLVQDTLSARLHPTRAVAALAGAIRAAGGEVVQGDRPDATAPVIWATGVAGLAALSATTGRTQGAAVKGQAALLAHDPGPGAPQIYADGLHIVPHDDGTVAIGSTSETAFATTAPDALLDAVIARARAACPALAGAAVVARWAGLRPRARSRMPLMGAWPGRPGQYIANGGFKIGFGIAPLVAETMADLLLDGQDRIPAPFRIQR